MKPLLVANWKMNPQKLKEARQLFRSTQKGIKNIKNIEVVICPPFVYIPIFQHSSNSTIKLGAQDCFWQEKGAFTGEISPKMLKDLGCQYVIIGHSERRKYLKETDEMINKKLKAVLKEKLKPILCVGESEEERNQGKTEKVLKSQLKGALKSIFNFQFSIFNLNIAYEPVWAIGTGKACRPAEAKKASNFIKKVISQISNQKIAKNIRILYGGSVNSKNASSYISEADFQGLLVGGASLKAEEFIKIAKNIS